MLILSRKLGESIIIGKGKNKIVIKLLQTQGKQAKLGIEAPREIPVHREEIFDLIKDKIEDEE